MSKIKIGVVGIGNCTSALIQGINYYRHKEEKDAIGLMHFNINGNTAFIHQFYIIKKAGSTTASRNYCIIFPRLQEEYV